MLKYAFLIIPDDNSFHTILFGWLPTPTVIALGLSHCLPLKGLLKIDYPTIFAAKPNETKLLVPYIFYKTTYGPLSLNSV